MMIKRSPSKNRTPCRGRRRDRAGTSTVEFSLCAPIIFFMFLGMIEVSRFHVLRHSIDQAVYMGARTAIVPGATAGEVDTVVRERLQLAGVISPTVTITPSVITTDTQSVTVQVSAPYGDNSWSVPKYFIGVIVAAEMTLDHENVAFN